MATVWIKSRTCLKAKGTLRDALVPESQAVATSPRSLKAWIIVTGVMKPEKCETAILKIFPPAIIT